MGQACPVITAAIINHNQRDRLRLVLHALRHQTMPSNRWEIVYVDDGSTDGSARMAEEMGLPNLRVIRFPRKMGRSVARNEGIRRARGEYVVILNGDMMPCPGFLEAHLRAHEGRGDRLVVGVEYSLPGTEYLEDPATGRWDRFPVPKEVRRRLRENRSEFQVTPEDVEQWTDRIVPRMVRGIYPVQGGGGELEQQFDRLFARYEEPETGWLSFYSHNGSVRKEVLERCGAFDLALDPYHQGRELSYRLFRMGIPTRRARRAILVHLYHHKKECGGGGFLRFQEPKISAQEYFRRKHGIQTLDALEVAERQILGDPWLPKPAPVRSLLDVERFVRAGEMKPLTACSELLDRHLLVGPLRLRIREREARRGLRLRNRHVGRVSGESR